jgi:hypothetical protein
MLRAFKKFTGKIMQGAGFEPTNPCRKALSLVTEKVHGKI